MDSVSGTGRAAQGREEVIRLYAEQRAGAYQGVRLRSEVTRVRMLAPGVALADTAYRLDGGKTDAGQVTFVLVKDAAGRWKISAIRAIRAAQG